MNCIVYIATSLDGFIATEDGGLDWLNSVPNPDNNDYGWADFNNQIDAILMGRKTFDFVLSFGGWLYEKPVHVLSTALEVIPDHLTDKATLHHGPISEVLADLEAQGIQQLYVDGGTLISSFLREDLIDEMIITRVPVLLGTGIPLFTNTGAEKSFTHLKTEVLKNALVKSHYTRVKPE
ncbi:MAG: dihydrofolate reductase [Opitutaceae bacterium]|jgi:dihydrofolate reductase|nr:dihydrofolate reductase [Opitutaceae bacterium]